MGLIGPGFIGPHHVDAVRRLGDVDVVAVAGSSLESARRKAAMLHIDKAYGDYRELLADPSIDVVHNTTPNNLHFPVNMAAIEAGKHVISDKPLGLNSRETAKLRDAAAAAGVVNAVTFNYRGNPLVQQMRLMREGGQIGSTFFVHGQYLQDWMTDDTVFSWRMDPQRGGASSALADIGSHWCDLAQHTLGARIAEVFADLTTVVKTRYAGGASDEAFQHNTKEDRIPKEIHGEDLAVVLVRFENGVKGCFTVGQVMPGHKNDLRIELTGREGSLHWEQERQNVLWIGRHNQPNALMDKDPSLMLPGAASYASLPGGHQEAWADAFRNVIADAYRWIRTGEKPPTVCTFEDADHTARVLDAMLLSAETNAWQRVESDLPVVADRGQINQWV